MRCWSSVIRSLSGFVRRLRRLRRRNGCRRFMLSVSLLTPGGLMSYSADLTELFRRSARIVDKILKGAKPADLPVEQPTKFEFVINMKTAKALGLALPPSLLLQADQ